MVTVKEEDNAFYVFIRQFEGFLHDCLKLCPANVQLI